MEITTHSQPVPQQQAVQFIQAPMNVVTLFTYFFPNLETGYFPTSFTLFKGATRKLNRQWHWTGYLNSLLPLSKYRNHSIQLGTILLWVGVFTLDDTS